MFGWMKTIVISLGGSVLFPTLEENRVSPYAEILRRISRMARLYVVVGGGGEARKYIAAARDLGLDEGLADEVGIQITRLNATLLAGALGAAAYPEVARTQTEACSFAVSGKIVVMGGITPAQTTDAVAAVLSERAHADLMVNLTSVDGIYTADPKTDPSAQRIERLTPDELMEIVGSGSLSAGSNMVIDSIAARVFQRSGIPLLVIDGRDPRNLEEALLKGRYSGSLVSVTGDLPVPIRSS
jgi:uridylate kinase